MQIHFQQFHDAIAQSEMKHQQFEIEHQRLRDEIAQSHQKIEARFQRLDGDIAELKGILYHRERDSIATPPPLLPIRERQC